MARARNMTAGHGAAIAGVTIYNGEARAVAEVQARLTDEIYGFIEGYVTNGSIGGTAGIGVQW